MPASKELIEKYNTRPEDISVSDIFPFMQTLLQQEVHLSKESKRKIQKNNEPDMPNSISGIYCVTPLNKETNDTVILTIGVHGNEIYAGALCALEVLNQQQNNTLNHNVIIQLGNIEAIKGYISAYNPEVYFLERNGWRETNGIEGEKATLDLGNEKTLEVLSDFNRIPSSVMTTARGLHSNIDRAQDLIWLHRSFVKGFSINDKNEIGQSGGAYTIRVVLSPHTSRMVGGIQNLSFPHRVMHDFNQSNYEKKLAHLPQALKTLLCWTGNGLGGRDCMTLDQHIEDEHLNSAPEEMVFPLIATIEFGHHENIKPEGREGLIELCGPTMATLLENASYINTPSIASDSPNSGIKVIDANPHPLKVLNFDGEDMIEEGDTVYLVCETNTVPYDKKFLQQHFTSAITVDRENKAEVIPISDTPDEFQGRVFYTMPRFELDFIRQGQVVLLAFGMNKKVKYITSPNDMYALFTGDARLKFPQVNRSENVLTEKIFFSGVVPSP